jgi:serine/threonine protein kinase
MLVDGKPEDTRSATVKILDIGTGRAALNEEDGAPGGALTVAGDQLGTPEYQAPEQAINPHDVDIRADLYSVGCILFHALAGEPPFVDKDRVRLMMRHVSEAPRTLMAVCPDAPPGLQGVLDRLLAKKAAQRYADPSEALKALAPFLPKVAQKSAGRERPELKAFLRWLQTETAAELDLPPTSAPAPTPAKNPVRRDLLADLANSTQDVDLPNWLAEDEPKAPGYTPVPAATDFGIDLSPGGRSAGTELNTLMGGKTGPGMRSLVMAAIAVGVIAVVLLLVVIILLIVR